jgi:hypothetical protein
VLESLKLLLDEPKLADLVIADLARWEDWSAVDRLVTLFKEAQDDNIFVREPIVNYLRACPLPEAAAAITELEAIDPQAVRRAATLAGLAAAITGPGAAADAGSGAGDDDSGSVAPADAPPPASPVPPAFPVPSGEQAESDPTAALALSPVLADDEATDDVPGRDVGQPSPAPAQDAGGGWKWLAAAALVLAIALVSRAVLRPAPAGHR